MLLTGEISDESTGRAPRVAPGDPHLQYSDAGIAPLARICLLVLEVLPPIFLLLFHHCFVAPTSICSIHVQPLFSFEQTVLSVRTEVQGHIAHLHIFVMFELLLKTAIYLRKIFSSAFSTSCPQRRGPETKECYQSNPRPSGGLHAAHYQCMSLLGRM
jgi:hypothetical protein